MFWLNKKKLFLNHQFKHVFWVLLSTHKIRFYGEIRKIIFNYTLIWMSASIKAVSLLHKRLAVLKSVIPMDSQLTLA